MQTAHLMTHQLIIHYEMLTAINSLIDRCWLVMAYQSTITQQVCTTALTFVYRSLAATTAPRCAAWLSFRQSLHEVFIIIIIIIIITG